MSEAERAKDQCLARLRTIIEDWRDLRGPLTARTHLNLPGDQPQYRLDDIRYVERFHERIISLAGKVWHLQEGFALWCRHAGLQISVRDALQRDVTGSLHARFRAYARGSVALRLCADLFNGHKHFELERPETDYYPKLNGVRIESADGFGIYFNAGAMESQIATKSDAPVPYRVEVVSGDMQHRFGNAIIVIAGAMVCWVRLIRQLGLLNDRDARDVYVAEGLAEIERETPPDNSG